MNNEATIDIKNEAILLLADLDNIVNAFHIERNAEALADFYIESLYARIDIAPPDLSDKEVHTIFEAMRNELIDLGLARE